MDTQYEKKYNDLMECLVQMHEHNVRRMSMALRSLLIVPTIFLVMLFFTNSSKTIFLVLWIVSMFIIAAVLIVIEYQDYTLRKMIARVGNGEPEPPVITESSEPSGGSRAEAILESIRSHSPENDESRAGSFGYDNYEEAPGSAEEQTISTKDE